MRRLKRAAMWIGAILLSVIVAVAITAAIVNEPRPAGRPGPQADALAATFERAVDIEAWERTKAVRWTFAGRHRHLWDRGRDVARVRWGDVEVLLRLNDRSGRAYEADAEVRGAAAARLVERAYAFWVNDAFWLNPLSMMRGDSVRRELVTLDDGGEALLITYTSGGLTPGDAYLWLPGDDGLPRAWRLWVSIIPIGGVETSWAAWQRLDTGALISTRHEGPLGLTIELSDVAGAETLGELGEEPDPFAPLFEE